MPGRHGALSVISVKTQGDGVLEKMCYKDRLVNG